MPANKISIPNDPPNAEGASTRSFLAQALDDSSEGEWDRKFSFFRWRDGVLGREDSDAFIDDIRDRERELGITDRDEARYRACKDASNLEIPF